MQTKELLSSLKETTGSLIEKAENLKTLTGEQLNRRREKDSWSVLECLEHLNLYGDFYLPLIEKGIRGSRTTPVAEYKSGWLGNYFANSMLPKEKLNKMKTFADKNPIHSKLDRQVIDRFINQQKQLLQLMEYAQKANINKIRIKTSISALIRLRLGDTLRFLVNHNIRHMAQAQRLIGN